MYGAEQLPFTHAGRSYKVPDIAMARQRMMKNNVFMILRLINGSAEVFIWVTGYIENAYFCGSKGKTVGGKEESTSRAGGLTLILFA